LLQLVKLLNAVLSGRYPPFDDVVRDIDMDFIVETK